MPFIKTSLIDIAKRVIDWDKSIDVYSNGDDNDYPERIDRYINNSVTAKTASNLMMQFLIGKGFGEADNIIVNKDKGLKLIDFADDLANSKVKQRGNFIHIGWNANFKIASVKPLPFGQCRLGKKDSKDYNGKILIAKDWTGKVQKKDVSIVDVYNPDPKVIESQVKKAGGWDKYKGQILYINDDNEYYYPLSRIDAVQLDCDNEHLSSVYKNRILRKGFFGKTMVLTRPLIDGNLPETIVDEKGEIVRNPEYLRKESEIEDFKKTIKDFLGAENADGVLHMELDFDGEKLEDAISFKNIESNINDKLFEYTETSTRRNILVAFNNLPIGLVEASEGIFSNSGEALKEMKQSYWESTNKERNALETIINDIMKRFEGYSGEYLFIKKLIEDDNAEVSQ